MNGPPTKKLKRFVYDELFDLILLQKLLPREQGDARLRLILSDLIGEEKKHLEFWQDITGVSQPKLPFFVRAKLNLFLFLRQIFGRFFTVLILEMLEIHATKKYFFVWDEYKETELAPKLREILQDELKHEGIIVSQRIERKINVDK